MPHLMGCVEGGDRAYQWVIVRRKRMLGTIWLPPISWDYGAGHWSSKR